MNKYASIRETNTQQNTATNPAVNVLAVQGHTPRLCKATEGAKRYAQGRGGNSQMFRCPVCDAFGWFNLNRLGSRHVMCAGRGFKTLPDRIGDMRAAGINFMVELQQTAKDRADKLARKELHLRSELACIERDRAALSRIGATP